MKLLSEAENDLFEDRRWAEALTFLSDSRSSDSFAVENIICRKC